MSEISDILNQAVIKIDILSERFDRHSEMYTDKFNTLFSKLDSLKDFNHSCRSEIFKRISDVELDGVKSNSASNIKIASISGGIAVVISVILLFIERALKI